MKALKIAALGIAAVFGVSLVLALGVAVLMGVTCTYQTPEGKTARDFSCPPKSTPAEVRRTGVVIVVYVGERRGWPGVPEGATPLPNGGGVFVRPPLSAMQ